MKRWPVVYSPDALTDLEAISRYLSREAGRSVASRWIAKLRRRARTIGDAPFAFMADPDLGPNRRRLMVDPYLIVYEVEPDRVLVIGVVHGARDLPGLFAGD